MKVPGKLRTTVAAAALMAATVPLSTSADAAWRHGGWGWGWGGFGVGLAAGALVGGALASPYYYGGYNGYYPGYYSGYYGYTPAYYGYSPGYYGYNPGYYGYAAPAYYGGYWGGGPYWWHRRHWHRW